MRPTLLNFRSPKEKTPGFYDSKLTHQGEYNSFKSKSLNKKHSIFPQAERFKQFRFVCGGSGASCFLGPGHYNDQNDYLKLTKQPCSSVMKKISTLPHSESGKPCYIMVGQNLTYEPSFVANSSQIKDNKQLNASDCKVSMSASMKYRSISQVKQRMTHNASMYSTNQNTSDRDFQKSIKDQFTGSLQINNDSDYETTKFREVNQVQRPSTSQQYKRPRIALNNSAMHFSNSSKKPVSIDQMGYASNGDRSTTIDPSTKNLQGIIEETHPDKEGGTIIQHNQEYELSNQNKVRVKSMLPRTATNFHKMKKGLYLNPLRGYPYDLKEEALARSLHILQAYGEIIPFLEKKTKTNKGSKKGNLIKGKKKIYQEDLSQSNSRYMNVIRDSPDTIKKREDLEKQKQEIMKMNFDQQQKFDMQNLNNFMHERYGKQQQYSTSVDDEALK